MYVKDSISIVVKCSEVLYMYIASGITIGHDEIHVNAHSAVFYITLTVNNQILILCMHS